MSYWNTSSVTDGIHTIMVTISENGLATYNYEENGTITSFERTGFEEEFGRGLIVGYQVH